MMTLRKNFTKSSMAFLLSIILLGLAIISSQNEVSFSNTCTISNLQTHNFESAQSLYTLIEEEEDAYGCYHLCDFSQSAFVCWYIHSAFVYCESLNIMGQTPFIYFSDKYKKNLIPIRS